MITAEHRDKQVGLMLTCMELLIFFNQWLLIFTKIAQLLWTLSPHSLAHCTKIYMYIWREDYTINHYLHSEHTHKPTEKKGGNSLYFWQKKKPPVCSPSYCLQQVIQMERKIKPNVKDFTRFILIYISSIPCHSLWHYSLIIFTNA